MVGAKHYRAMCLCGQQNTTISLRVGIAIPLLALAGQRNV